MKTAIEIATIALAFTGVIVGAGFASGQEVTQFFVAFGPSGVVGAGVSAIVMGLVAMIILQLGSYFNAEQHDGVFRRVSHPIFSKILDAGVMATLFSVGFVMFAGAGSNLHQQFGTDIWIGAVIMLVFVLAAGMLDVDRVTQVIGAITPFIIVLMVIAAVWVIAFSPHAPSAELHAAAKTIDTTLPNWWVAAINYGGFNMMVAVSMAVVIGGRVFNPRVAGVGGLLGGLIYSTLLFLSAWTLYCRVGQVARDDVPMLTVISDISPVLGHLTAFVVFGMVFNTALGMFYALARRLSAGHPERFKAAYIGSVLVGFVLSFVGFRALVGAIYPIRGYVGILLIAVMFAAWIRGRARIMQETSRRVRILELLQLRRGPSWNPEQQRELVTVVEESNLDRERIATAVSKRK